MATLFHSHKCANCAQVWHHDRNAPKTEQEYDKAHDCPRCGVNERMRYFGPGCHPQAEAELQDYRREKESRMPPGISALLDQLMRASVGG